MTENLRALVSAHLRRPGTYRTGALVARSAAGIIPPPIPPSGEDCSENVVCLDQHWLRDYASGSFHLLASDVLGGSLNVLKGFPERPVGAGRTGKKFDSFGSNHAAVEPDLFKRPFRHILVEADQEGELEGVVSHG